MSLQCIGRGWQLGAGRSGVSYLYQLAVQFLVPICLPPPQTKILLTLLSIIFNCSVSLLYYRLFSPYMLSYTCLNNFYHFPLSLSRSGKVRIPYHFPENTILSFILLNQHGFLDLYHYGVSFCPVAPVFISFADLIFCYFHRSLTNCLILTFWKQFSLIFHVCSSLFLLYRFLSMSPGFSLIDRSNSAHMPYDSLYALPVAPSAWVCRRKHELIQRSAFLISAMPVIQSVPTYPCLICAVFCRMS